MKNRPYSNTKTIFRLDKEEYTMFFQEYVFWRKMCSGCQNSIKIFFKRLLTVMMRYIRKYIRRVHFWLFLNMTVRIAEIRIWIWLLLLMMWIRNIYALKSVALKYLMNRQFAHGELKICAFVILTEIILFSEAS